MKLMGKIYLCLDKRQGTDRNLSGVVQVEAVPKAFEVMVWRNHGGSILYDTMEVEDNEDQNAFVFHTEAGSLFFTEFNLDDYRRSNLDVFSDAPEFKSNQQAHDYFLDQFRQAEEHWGWAGRY